MQLEGRSVGASGHVMLPWYDWLVFGVMLLVSLAIGVYHSLTGGKQRSTGEYLLGDRKMSLLPVLVSATVSYVSTITLLGYPAEMYAFGAQYWLGSIAITFGAILAALVFVPVLYPLQMTSVNEYLEKRFESKAVRKIGSAASILSAVLIVGNWIYAPSTALEAVTGFPAWAAIILGSSVAIFYTTIGGFKAVVYADFFQSIVMLLGLVAVVIAGLIRVGGFSEVWRINEEWGRLNFIVLDPDPTLRMNIWGVVLAMTFAWAWTYGVAQMGVQRYASLPTLRQAKICVLGIVPGTVLISSLSCIAGLIIFAYYTSVGCDPVKGKFLTNYNQILPYFVVDVIRIPGFSGLVMACVFAGSLSSVSSGVNAMTANIWEDFLKEHMSNIVESRAAVVNKITAVCLGIISTGFAFAMSELGGTILQMIFAITSCVAGPMLALFFMAVFLPWINWKGACLGLLSGFLFGVWLAIGYLTTDKNWTPLPSPSENCTLEESISNHTLYVPMAASALSNTLSSAVTTTATAVAKQPIEGLQRFYSLSFIWHHDVSGAVTVVTAIFFSAITGFRTPSTVPAKYVHPLLAHLVQLDTTEDEIKTDLKETTDYSSEVKSELHSSVTAL